MKAILVLVFVVILYLLMFYNFEELIVKLVFSHSSNKMGEKHSKYVHFTIVLGVVHNEILKEHLEPLEH